MLWLYVSQPRAIGRYHGDSRGDPIDDRDSGPDRDHGSNVITIPTGASAIVNGTVATPTAANGIVTGGQKTSQLKRQKQTAWFRRVRRFILPEVMKQS